MYNALMDYVAFKELHEFVSNDAATRVHASSYEVVGDVDAFSEAQIDRIRTSKTDPLKEALSHLGNQTIISLCTTLEVSAREYLRAMFLTLRRFGKKRRR